MAIIRSAERSGLPAVQAYQALKPFFLLTMIPFLVLAAKR
jgi:hypothetical protein